MNNNIIKHPSIKLFSGIICLILALTISCVAAFFSITGLATIFSTAFVSVIIMGVALESGKLVTTGWLHANWKNKRVSFFIKLYLSIAIIALMLITGIGIYGYLSKAYLDQSIPSNTVVIKINDYQQKIKFDNDNISGLLNQQKQMDAQIDSLLSQNHVYLSQIIKKQQLPERQSIQNQINQYQTDIENLNNAMIPLQVQKNNSDTALGPIKYVAALIGWTNYAEAVRLIILIIMIAFDPLAVVLLLASTISFGEWIDCKSQLPDTVKPTNDDFYGTNVPSSSLVDAVKKVSEFDILGSNNESVSLQEAFRTIKNKNPEAFYREDKSKKTMQEMVNMIEENPEFLQELITIVTEYNQKNQ